MKNVTLQIHSDGTKEWKLNGKYHRLDGPAFIGSWGNKFWCQNGKFHRLDGPACEYASGTKEWFVNDIRYTEAQFNNIILTNWIWFFS